MDTFVDARRLLCPLPLIRAEAAMKPLPPGAILVIHATDRGLHQDLPAWCAMHGHTLLEIRN
ncbi:MAG: sulfurtransferase TusA family protein, partial [Magnetococcales bacterium]|nr:sulfurtransferase TusA family protein [Magnetococcales bacterium]